MSMLLLLRRHATGRVAAVASIKQQLSHVPLQQRSSMATTESALTHSRLLSLCSSSSPNWSRANTRTPHKSVPLPMSSGAMRSSFAVDRLFKYAPGQLVLARGFSSNPWNRRTKSDVIDALKAGGLVVLGTGVLLASTSLAFGLIITGAAGYGIYTLYRKFFRNPFAEEERRLRQWEALEDSMNELLGRPLRRARSRPSATSRRDEEELTSPLDRGLFAGMPTLLRGVFSLVTGLFKVSMQRTKIVRDQVNQRLQRNQRIVADFGSEVEVGSPSEWSESSINGFGRVRAVFPVTTSHSHRYAQVQVEASYGDSGDLHIKKMMYYNPYTNESIDLTRDDLTSSNHNNKKRVVMDAEYVEVEDPNRSKPW